MRIRIKGLTLSAKVTVIGVLLFGLLLYGQPTQLQVQAAAPPAPTGGANVVGAQGGATLFYWVIAHYPIGSVISDRINAPNTVGVPSLNATNFVTISWTAMDGATGYDVIRNTAPAFPSTCSACAVVLNTAATTVNDTGGGLAFTNSGGASTALGTFTLNNRDEAAPFMRLQLNGNLFRIAPFVGPYTVGHGVQIGIGGTLSDSGAAAGGGGGGGGGNGGVNHAPITVSSGTTALTATSNTIDFWTLNLTVSTTLTMTGQSSGELLFIKACQPVGGGLTLALPAGFTVSAPISPEPNVCSTAQFHWDASSATWAGTWLDGGHGICVLQADASTNPSTGDSFNWCSNIDGTFKVRDQLGNITQTVRAGAGIQIIGGVVSGNVGTGTTAASGAGSLNSLGSIASTACGTLTIAVGGVLSTDTIIFTPNASIKAVVGFVPATSGGLTIAAFPTAGNINFDVCNWSTGALTPGTGAQLNWRVVR